MEEPTLRIVFLGLSITSSWGNRHAATYRALIGGLSARGHEVLFLERDLPWYQGHRDEPEPPGCTVAFYEDLPQLRDRWGGTLRDADVVILGSYLPQGVEIARFIQKIARGVVAFYDLDTPVTLARLARGDEAYLVPELIPGFHLYLSFTGGPILERLELQYGAQQAMALHGAVDPARYPTDPLPPCWDLGYLGTYHGDRQPALQRLLLDVARRRPHSTFAIYGTGYPTRPAWPENVLHRSHLPPAGHPRFYCRQRFTLNLTRPEMAAAGFSPSLRLFEAAACGTPVISDPWPGIHTWFRPGEEILIARHTDEVLAYLHDLSEDQREEIGRRARARVLARHTAAHRAQELCTALYALRGDQPALRTIA